MKWYEHSFRRCLLDMHIPDWDDAFLSRFDPDQYVEAVLRSGADAAYFYASSCVGLANFPSKTIPQHRGLRASDAVGEVIRRLHNSGIRSVIYVNVWSKVAYDRHPDWRCLDPLGRGTGDYLWGMPGRFGVCCLNSPYADVFLTLTEELASHYDFDGFWVDMILWRMACCCPHCRARFLQETGQEIPEYVDWRDPVWRSYLRHREIWVEEFFSKIISIVKRYRPEASVLCNSGYYGSWVIGESLSFYRLGEFLGGDFSADRITHSFQCKLLNSLSAHRPVEFLAPVMDPSLEEHSIIKSPEHLLTLLFSTIANNGRFGFIDAIDPKGTLNLRVYDRMREVFAEARPYERFLRPETRLIYDVGLYTDPACLMSPAENGKRLEDAGNGTSPHAAATLAAAGVLMNLHVPYCVLTPFDLDTLSGTDTIVICDLLCVSEETGKALRRFVREGGSLYVSGATGRYDADGREVPCGSLQDLIGVIFCGEENSPVTYLCPTEKGSTLFPGYDEAHPLTLRASQMRLKAMPDTKVLATLSLPWTDPTDTSRFASAISNPPGPIRFSPAITYREYGKGRVVYAAGPLEAGSTADHEAALLRILRLLLRRPFSIETDAPACVEINSYEEPEDHRIILNLVNDQEHYPSVPIFNIMLQLRFLQPVRRVLALPEEIEVPISHRDDCIEFCVDRLDIFRMYSVEYGD